MNAPIRRADFGPRVVLQRGERVRHERPDIDAPNRTVLGVRRRCILYDMAGPRPTDAWRARVEAARIYAEAVEIADGGRDGPCSAPEVRVDAGIASYGPGDRQIAAAALVRRATGAMGMTGTQVINAIVLRGCSLEEARRIVLVGRDAIGGYVISVLDRLVEVV